MEIQKKRNVVTMAEEQGSCKWFMEVLGNEKRIVFDCEDCLENAIATNHKCMKAAIDPIKLEDPDKLIFKKDFQRTYNRDVIKNIMAVHNLSKEISIRISDIKTCEKCEQEYDRLLNYAHNPIGIFYIIEDISLCKSCMDANIDKIREIIRILKSSKLIKEAAITTSNPEVAYDTIFPAVLVPNLITSNISLNPPDTEKLDEYNVGDVKVSIFASSDRPDNIYFIHYPEFNLNIIQFKAIQNVFKDICNATIPNLGSLEVRKEFGKIIEEALERYAKGIKDKDTLMRILLRHTVGYGLVEPLLMDENLQDIYVDSASRLVHVVHSRYAECLTNIWLSTKDIEKLTTRLRMLSGRPFDASSPVLHTELSDLGIRVAAIAEPSTYGGVGFAFRRRKSNPWTLPEFIRFNMLTPEAAGLLSFLIDGNTSILIVGPRGSGKTSLMTSLLLEMPINNRIIIIEDTPEIPVEMLRSLGYKIEHLRTEAFAKGYELSAEDALRTSLRLGESILVLGEVRGPEARALFEAMRIGAVGNVVMGTIHGSGPYDVWDRVTNDLGVPSTSFKATDIIVTTGTIRRGDATQKIRRVMSITEVRKDWREEPKFYDIMKYDRAADKLVMNDLFKSETIKKIAAMKGFNKKQVKDNIANRVFLKSMLTKAGAKNRETISAKKVVAANNLFIKLSARGLTGKKMRDALKRFISTSE